MDRRILNAGLQDAVGLVDSAIEQIEADRRDAEFDSFGKTAAVATKRDETQAVAKDDGWGSIDDFGDFGGRKKSNTTSDAIKVLLVRASEKIHMLIKTK